MGCRLWGRTESDTTEVTQQQQQCAYAGLPGSSAGKESACNAGDSGSIPGLGRAPGERNSYPLQYSGLENSMEGIPWGPQQGTVHGITKSRT